MSGELRNITTSVADIFISMRTLKSIIKCVGLYRRKKAVMSLRQQRGEDLLLAGGGDAAAAGR